MQRSEDRAMWMVSPFQQFRSGSWLPWRIEDGFEAKEPSRAQGSNSLKASRSNPSRQKSQPRSFPMTTHAIQLTGWSEQPARAQGPPALISGPRHP